MGSLISRVFGVVKLILELKDKLNAIEERIRRSPGLPIPHPTTPFWMVPPSLIAHNQSPLPSHVDVVIIGSGITGTSAARVLLNYPGKERLSVAMLEARTVCSGATGRNGGHINPPLYQDYSDLKKEHGADMAKRIIRWRLSHLHELQRAASEEGITEQSQIREVNCLDVHYSAKKYDEAKRLLVAWKEDMQQEAEGVYAIDGDKAATKYGLGSGVAGVIVAPGGAVHPYNLVTGTLSNLLKQHSDHFFLSTHTPCTAIQASSSQLYYTVQTPRGNLTARHVIHATNGWSSHLLHGFRTKIIPFRGHMSAQRPGRALAEASGSVPGDRAHIFYNADLGYDYLTQLPSGEQELMFGGGFLRNGQISLSEVGEVDDGGVDIGVASHISGALPMYFGLNNWGAEAEPASSSWQSGRIKSLWTGVIALSVDGRPWIGRLPSKITGRKTSTPSAVAGFPGKGEGGHTLTAAPGEWIAAGFSGEGMVNAWQSARALAYMVLGVEEEVHLQDWFPEVMRVTQRRWRHAMAETLLDRF